MIKNRNKHKNKYRRKSIDYTYSKNENVRSIPFGVKISILFGGVIQIIGIIFTITGLSIAIPIYFTDIPIEILWVPAIFPAIGIAMLGASVSKKSRYLKIIKTGKFVYGTYIRYETTNVAINDSPVIRFFFEFNDEQENTFTASGETHTGRLSDEPQELLAYNPDNPEEAVMIDSLPSSVKNYILKLIVEEREGDDINDH